MQEADRFRSAFAHSGRPTDSHGKSGQDQSDDGGKHIDVITMGPSLTRLDRLL